MTRRPKTRAAAEAKHAPKKDEPATRKVPTPKAATSKAAAAKAAAGAKGAAPKAGATRSKAPTQVPASQIPRARSAASPVADASALAKPSQAKGKQAMRAATTAKTPAKIAGPASSLKRKPAESRARKAETSTRQAAEKSPKAKAKPTARDKPKSSRKAPATQPSARRKAPKPAYLAAELGQPVDREGEPIGAGSAMLSSDSSLQEYALQLWRQMQSGGVVNRYMRAIERAGLTTDEVWTAGVIETRTTSSTPDELRRYKQKLLFRANLLEAILSETVADLHRLEGLEPTPPPGAAASSALTASE